MTIQEATWNDLAEYRDDLEHYGVKGMRWGVRKKQESSSGKRRSSKKKTFSQKVQAKRAARAKRRVAKAKARSAKEAAAKQKKAEKAKAKQEQRRRDILNNPTKLYKHRREFSPDEIQNAMKQFDWERRLNQYSRDQLNNGADFINTMFKYANNSINLYNTAARVVNSFSDTKDMPYIQQIPGGDKKKDKKD